MVAMAPDPEYLYAAVKCLFCALRTNSLLREQMAAQAGFQLVGMMLKRKKDCLNPHVLHLAFSLMAAPGTFPFGAAAEKQRTRRGLGFLL